MATFCGRFVLILAATFLSSPAVSLAAEGSLPGGLPPGERPVRVMMGVDLTNITEINEREETIEFDAAISLRWLDPRLAYDAASAGMEDFVPGDYSHAPTVGYESDFQVRELFEGWRPAVTILNGIGNRATTNMAVLIWPDGMVEYQEVFYAKAEAPMNMRMFPFDTHELEIFVHPFIYHRDELILVPDDRLTRTWNQNMGIADWSRGRVSIDEQTAELIVADGSTATVSEVVIRIGVERRATHFLLSIIVPLIVLVALTWCVFWMDEESVSNRVNISFIGILSVVAYYLVIQNNIPEVSYITLIDGFILGTFVLLAASVIISIVVDKLNSAERRSLGDSVDRVCRWAFPVTYGAVIALTYFVFQLL